MAWAYGFPLSHWNPKPTNCYHKLWLIKHSFFQRKQYRLMCKKSAKYILSVLSFYWINSLSMLFPPPPPPGGPPRAPFFFYYYYFYIFLEAKCFSLAYLFRAFTFWVLYNYYIQYIKKLLYLLQSKSTVCFLRLAEHEMNKSCKREQLGGYGLNSGGMLAKGLPMPLSVFERLRYRIKV